MEFSPDQRGSLAELAVAGEAARMGLGILWSLTNGLRYDLVLDARGLLYRVQCKTARLNGDVVVIRCRTCRRTAFGYERRSYTTDCLGALPCGLNRSQDAQPFSYVSRRRRTTNGNGSTGRRISSSPLQFDGLGP
ncbi:MAG: hypothetical protein E6G08_21660 [Actinobacteria bacterium]|nr:MAG: hypothetical protein E6G08_21660 [Actinomycetota bacterium]